MAELIFVFGCNVAGKSTFIRSGLNQLVDIKTLMTELVRPEQKMLLSKP